MPHLHDRKSREVYADTGAFLARIKHLARVKYPYTRSAQRCEALAAGLGCASYATLLVKLAEHPSGLPSVFDLPAFEARLGKTRASEEYAKRDDFHLDIGEALLGWLFGNDGYVTTAGMRVSMELMTRRENQRREEVIARLASQGVLPSPPADASWGIPGSLSWSVCWLGERDRVETVALRLHARHGRKTFGWGERAPGHGVSIPVHGMLTFLSGGWLAACVSDSRLPANFNSDIRSVIGDQSLPLLRCRPTLEGLVIEDDTHRFAPGIETVLAVEALSALGDALAGRIQSLGGSASDTDIKAVEAWHLARKSDGLRPLREDVHDEHLDPAFEEASAQWMSNRIGMPLPLYERAALFVYNHNREHDATRENIPEWDGLVLAGMNMLGNFEPAPVNQLAKARALRALNLSVWPAAYYMRWDERRGARLDEIVATTPQRELDALHLRFRGCDLNRYQ